MIQYASYKEIKRLIEIGFATGIPEVQCVCEKMIAHAPLAVQNELIHTADNLIMQGLSIDSPEKAEVYIGMGSNNSYAHNARIKEKIGQIIKEGLSSGSVKDREVWARNVKHAPWGMLAELLTTCIESNIPSVQRYAIPVICYTLSKEKRALLFSKCEKSIDDGIKNSTPEMCMSYAKIIQTKALPLELKRLWFSKFRDILGESIISPALYTDTHITNENFRRENFEKTGSETTLIGGLLKNKTIIRKIDSKAFLSWQTLYEDYQVWKNVGFDYVPIEPIQSFKLNMDGLVDVYTSVLDLSLAIWNGMSLDFYHEIYSDIEKIRRVLASREVEHGHDHHENFCLRFFRDAEGRVDFSKQPRVYMIDFDMASSSSKSTMHPYNA
jgi:hypothetical protein